MMGRKRPWGSVGEAMEAGGAEGGECATGKVSLPDRW
jgi:hypothetical protein